MGSAKDILLRPISASVANELVERVHYSGKVAPNSQMHIGVYYEGKLEGALQFGPSMAKRKIQGLVTGTGWNEFIELNRMAFTDVLPRNSESRAIAVSMRLLSKYAPHIKWVVSFADGTLCGDGTIYRASGFVLTGIKENQGTYVMPNGEVVNTMTFGKQQYAINNGGKASGKDYIEKRGGVKAVGFQLRYIYFLDPSYRERLTVPELPFSAIEEAGARMYKGEKL